MYLRMNMFTAASAELNMIKMTDNPVKLNIRLCMCVYVCVCEPLSNYCNGSSIFSQNILKQTILKKKNKSWGRIKRERVFLLSCMYKSVRNGYCAKIQMDKWKKLREICFVLSLNTDREIMKGRDI